MLYIRFCIVHHHRAALLSWHLNVPPIAACDKGDERIPRTVFRDDRCEAALKLYEIMCGSGWDSGPTNLSADGGNSYSPAIAVAVSNQLDARFTAETPSHSGLNILILAPNRNTALTGS